MSTVAGAASKDQPKRGTSMIKLGSHRRRWWLALGLIVALAAPAALALTALRITGVIETVAGRVSSGQIQEGDPFSIEVLFNEDLLTGGVESVTSATDPDFRFTLDIDHDLIQHSADDLRGSAILTLDDGGLRALQFMSVDFGGGLAPLAYTNLVATGPLLALSGSLEILDAEGPDENDLLVLGRFIEASVSVN
jgi:hypothetical protein